MVMLVQKIVLKQPSASDIISERIEESASDQCETQRQNVIDQIDQGLITISTLLLSA